MRIRIVHGFSGNNSGSYVLVGSFREASTATALAAELREIFAAHAAWLDTVTAQRAETSPLHAYASAQGLVTDATVGTNDEWPAYGTPPSVEHTHDQLLVFVDYSVTFPRFLGELFYRRGGRVSVELNHSHDPIVVSHTIWLHEGWNDRPRAEQLVGAFREEVESGALAALYRDAEGKDGPPPILAPGFWPGNVELVHAPRDVAEGIRTVTALARKHGLDTYFALFESPLHTRDPIRGYRALDHATGDHQVILWKPGPVLADTVRVVRGATGLTLAEASEMVARAPVEVLLGIGEEDATAWRDALIAIGADAEMLGPQHFRREE